MGATWPVKLVCPDAHALEAVHAGIASCLERGTPMQRQACAFYREHDGRGDPPNSAADFVRNIMEEALRLHELHFAIPALGDRFIVIFVASVAGSGID
jgi:sulfite reductase alpha subunit-like flavoprotein